MEGEASKSLSEENKTMIEKRLGETFLTLAEEIKTMIRESINLLILVLFSSD